jgi:hypothetical protein
LVSQLEPSGTNWIKTKEKFASRVKIRKWKTGFKPVFHLRSDLFPLSVSLITSARRGKMDADKGKRSLGAKKFASGKPA